MPDSIKCLTWPILYVYESGDILDTMIYRIAFNDAQYGAATAVGLFKSVVSFC